MKGNAIRDTAVSNEWGVVRDPKRGQMAEVPIRSEQIWPARFSAALGLHLVQGPSG